MWDGAGDPEREERGVALTALAISLFSSPLAIAAAVICAGGLGTIITGRTLAWWHHG